MVNRLAVCGRRVGEVFIWCRKSFVMYRAAEEGLLKAMLDGGVTTMECNPIA
jgi:hypothetical protein